MSSPTTPGLLPELANRGVLTRLDAPLHDTVPAHRDVMTRDLLTPRLGFGFVFGPAPDYPILAAAHERKLGIGPPCPASPDQLTPAQKTASPNVSVFLGSLGWGFGMAVATQRDDAAAAPGQFGWTAASVPSGAPTPPRTR